MTPGAGVEPADRGDPHCAPVLPETALTMRTTAKPAPVPAPTTVTHTTDEDDHVCTRCGAERCPVCHSWFPDYDTFLTHLEHE